ncbi:hypothetical protein O7605_16360 [Verrucosispora sp. WMMA2121]|uniref:TOTE conflict system archaeo-eukaryotic primase domain-containing protein n=1 Tax=Verrucosispora sp. WMMA2121 TaxID=3015164 RepID=UPI0022B6DD68|nr:hypothetical protein [Verrucosispora sp. WMMA2121]MCZ7421084.1 hypothetical protein [Verrucosispora sp. WMMA2121]
MGSVAEFVDLRREVERLRAENARLARLLELRGQDTTAAPEQLSAPVDPPGLVTMASPTRDKLALFADRFRARTDVYAVRWDNARTGAAGWMPAVAGGWRKGIDRRGATYLPRTTEVVAAHLVGDVFMGLYPLMPGNTCHFVVADFDGPTAMLDALAYVKAARASAVPAAMEISQSGRGAHVWIFFTGGDAGYAAIALLAPVGYLISAVLARFCFARDELGPDEALPHRPGVAGEAAAVVRGMVDGVRHLGRARGAAYAIGAQAGFRLLFGLLALAMLLLYRNRFAGDDLDGVPAQLGLVFAAGAAGVLLAAAATPDGGPPGRRVAVGGRVARGGRGGVAGVRVAVRPAAADRRRVGGQRRRARHQDRGGHDGAARVRRHLSGAAVRRERHGVQPRLRARHGGRSPVHPGRRALTAAARCRRGRLRLPRGRLRGRRRQVGPQGRGRHRPAGGDDAGSRPVTASRAPDDRPADTDNSHDGDAAVAVVCHLTLAAPCAVRVSS